MSFFQKLTWKTTVRGMEIELYALPAREVPVVMQKAVRLQTLEKNSADSATANSEFAVEVEGLINFMVDTVKKYSSIPQEVDIAAELGMMEIMEVVGELVQGSKDPKALALNAGQNQTLAN